LSPRAKTSEICRTTNQVIGVELECVTNPRAVAIDQTLVAGDLLWLPFLRAAALGRAGITDGLADCKLVAKRTRENGREIWEVIMVNKALVHGELVFVSNPDRCLYIGKWASKQPQWLKDNPDKWRYLEDVLREEAISPPPPAESKIGLGAELAVGNDQTSSHSVQVDGDDDDVAISDALAADRSPPHEPTSLPTTVAATENETTKPEVLRAADATMSGAEGPKTETIPLGTIDHKPGCSDGSPTKKQKQIAKARKLSPERMRIVINTLTESPILSDAAGKAGIHRKTLEYWIKRSEAGDPGYDLVWEDIEWRFHEHCITAISYAYDKVLAPARDLAMGPKYNGKMLRFLLEWFRPERYGKHRKIDVPQQGGVLVVGGVRHDISSKVNKDTAAGVRARKWKAGLRMVREEKNNTDC
jgi:hypothetical protein